MTSFSARVAVTPLAFSRSRAHLGNKKMVDHPRTGYSLTSEPIITGACCWATRATATISMVSNIIYFVRRSPSCVVSVTETSLCNQETALLPSS
jgi:hypothetical protein